MKQTNVDDHEAIYQAVTDYYEGWYTPNPEQMEQCLHADLAKRGLNLDAAGREYLRHLTKEVMVEATRQGGGSAGESEIKNWTIAILDSYREIATVKVASVEYMEYIHLVKQAGQWLVVNVIWTDRKNW